MAILENTVRVKQNYIARHPMLSFVVFALLFGWLSITPSLAWGLPFKPFQTAGAYGPFLAALLVTVADGNEALKAHLRRITNFRFGVGWYLFALLFYVALYLVVVGLTGAPVIETLAGNWLLLVTAYLPALLTIYLLNAFGEESGWTGFAQDRLQARFHPVWAAALLGIIVAMWHLPAYFVPSEMGAFNPINFAVFTLSVIFTRIIWMWAANHARGSGIFASLLHASGNAVTLALIPAMFPAPAPEQLTLSTLFLLAISLVLALGLVILTRGKLGYRH